MSNVTQFPGAPTPDMDPDDVLGKALGKTIEAIVIGFEPDGTLYFDGSTGEVGTVLTLMELAKKKLLEGFA